MTELNITFEDDGVILFWFRMSGVVRLTSNQR